MLSAGKDELRRQRTIRIQDLNFVSRFDLFACLLCGGLPCWTLRVICVFCWIPFTTIVALSSKPVPPMMSCFPLTIALFTIGLLLTNRARPISSSGVPTFFSGLLPRRF